MTTLIEASINKWRANIKTVEAGLVQQGIAQGMERGIAQGVERGIERGIAQGIERGEARARADQRALLLRLAGRKFGGWASVRLSALIEDESDPERLADVSDWIIDCDTETEFLTRAGRSG